MQETERSAASVEEAVEAALEELAASEQEVVIEIVQEPRGGFLGVGAQPAVVRVRLRGSSSASDLEPAALEEQGDIAADFLEGLFERAGIPAEAEPGMVDGMMYVDVWSTGDEDGAGLLIGRHGQTLEALQELVRSVVQQRTQERCLVIVDVEDYRKRRRSQLVSRAQSVARKVKKSGRPEGLEPMSAFERKIVHDAVAEVGGVETASEGVEPDRRVVIRQSGPPGTS